MLDLRPDATNAPKGLLPPRLTQPQRDAIASPAAGLVVFNTTTNSLNVWNGSSWLEYVLNAEQASFAYTGAPQTYTVPTGVTHLAVDMAGASGGESASNSGGLGGRVQATLRVTPGEVLTIYVGGAGAPGAGGYNGGGTATTNAGGGGGATAQTLTNDGAAITVQSGATLYVSGGTKNNAGSTLANDGTVQLTGDLINQGTFTSDGTLGFFGTTNQSFTPGNTTDVAVITVNNTGSNGQNILNIPTDLAVMVQLTMLNGMVRTAPGATVHRLARGLALLAEWCEPLLVLPLPCPSREPSSGKPAAATYKAICGPYAWFRAPRAPSPTASPSIQTAKT